MPSTLPAQPTFGEPLPIQPSAETLALLSARRSSSAQTLSAPGPDAGQVADLIRLAARAPDHGKLNPWRFIVIEGAAKAALVQKLARLAETQQQPGKAAAVLGKLSAPPVTIAVVSSPVEGQIPLWEQELSAGAVCTLMLAAAEAMGFGANWITDWYGYDAQALALIGVGGREKLAGFIHVGTPSEPPLERVRPDTAALTTRL